MAREPLIIFSPGPSNLSPRVRAALQRPDVGHRDGAFFDLQRDIRARLSRLFALGADDHVVLFGGSATLAIESLLTAAGAIGPVLVLANGHYGERAAEILQTCGLPHQVHRVAWGATIDRETVARALQGSGQRSSEQRSGEVRSVYLVHHETTTGILNPLQEIAALVAETGRYLLVDGVSSLAGEELDVRGWKIDGLVGSSTKCLRSTPGVALLFASGRFIQEARSRARRHTYYSDLLTHLDAEDAGPFPFTPPVHALFALQEALAELQEEGLGNRLAHYERVARRLRGGLAALGLSLYLPAETLARTMTPVGLPAGFTYRHLYENLKTRGFLIYPGVGEMAQEMFRLGTVGYFGEPEIDEFVVALRDVLHTA